MIILRVTFVIEIHIYTRICEITDDLVEMGQHNNISGHVYLSITKMKREMWHGVIKL